MFNVFIGIGSNLGDREKNIKKALEYFKKNPHIKIKKISSIIETEPWGYTSQPKYLNGVIKIKTELSPLDLLKFLQEVEKKLGRERKIKYGPRTIDLDILLYGDKIINLPQLKIPHPRMWEREFVLKPLLEIEPLIMKKLDKLKNDYDKKH